MNRGPDKQPRRRRNVMHFRDPEDENSPVIGVHVRNGAWTVVSVEWPRCLRFGCKGEMRGAVCDRCGNQPN